MFAIIDVLAVSLPIVLVYTMKIPIEKLTAVLMSTKIVLATMDVLVVYLPILAIIIIQLFPECISGMIILRQRKKLKRQQKDSMLLIHLLRLVKLASKMQRTGKSAKNANYYLIAANGFVTEYHDDDTEEASATEDNSKPILRKRGNNKGTKKLVDMENVLFGIELDVGKINDFTSKYDHVRELLKNSDSVKQEKDDHLLCQIMSSFDDAPKSNFRTRKKNLVL